MAVGVLLLAVSSFLGGQDHGLGSVITGAIKVGRGAGGGRGEVALAGEPAVRGGGDMARRRPGELGSTP
jgi:hypothetical protein